MSANVMIEAVNNGWIAKVFDSDPDIDDTPEVHCFTDKTELVEWLIELLESD